MRLGVSSDWVLYLQQLHNHLGYPVEENVSFDESAEDMVRQLQLSAGL